MTSDFHDYNQIRNSDFVGCAFWIVVVLLAFAATRGCSTAEAAWPRTGPLTDDVDAIELNHFYDDQGRLVFSQFIFWEYRGEHKFVVDWRMVKDDVLPVQRNGRYEYTFLDHDGIFRRVRAMTYGESWTQFDPEQEHRMIQPKEFRRGLLIRQHLDYKDGERVPPQVEWR
jgi:hypothetical protein